jgi:hypothetical protein
MRHHFSGHSCRLTSGKLPRVAGKFSCREYSASLFFTPPTHRSLNTYTSAICLSPRTLLTTSKFTLQTHPSFPRVTDYSFKTMASPSERRTYEEIPYVEELEDYRPGGFHPVHIGDRFKDNRYLIVNKLGHGGFSTVWLAEDTVKKECVAASIQKAELSQSDEWTREIKILQHLANDDSNHPGRSCVLLPQDIFKLSGPNGTHVCIITPLQGQSLSMVTKRKRGKLSEILPLSKAKKACLDIIRAFSFIHSKGIVHAGMENTQCLHRIQLN